MRHRSKPRPDTSNAAPLLEQVVLQTIESAITPAY